MLFSVDGIDKAQAHQQKYATDGVGVCFVCLNLLGSLKDL
jgi:hypothetical protein